MKFLIFNYYYNNYPSPFQSALPAPSLVVLRPA